VRILEKISYLIAIAAMLPVLFSCSDNVQEEVLVGSSTMTVNISCSGMTRAVVPGSDYYNENLLKALDIFFYSDSADTDCFEHERIEGSYSGNFTYTKHLEILTKEKLFGTGDTGSCYVYVIANGPQAEIDTLLQDGTASVANLKKIVLVSPDLGNSEVRDDMGDMQVMQNYFVMDGGASMDYNNGSASVDVKLARSLSKIQLYVHFPDSVVVNGKAYKPSIISVNTSSKKALGKAVFSNGLMKGYIDDSDASNAYSPSEGDYYPAEGLTYDGKARYVRDSVSTNGKIYYTHSPFYTYPMTWKTYSDSLATRPTTLMLVVDWYNSEDSGSMSAMTTFYTINVNMTQDSGEEYKFKRNSYYRLYVDVNTIGSDASTDPVEITGVCEILDWYHVYQQASIENLRYLTVDQNEYVLDNEETLYIPYTTSHDCEISSITASKVDLTGDLVDTVILNEADTVSVSGNIYSVTDGYDFLDDHREFSIEIDDENLIFRHSLENRESVEDTDFDYTPFEVTFTVRHKDNYSYYQTIHIKQHPELSIEAQINSDFVDEPVDNDDNTHEGYVYVNGYNCPLGEGSGYLGYKSSTYGYGYFASPSLLPKGLFKADNGNYYTYYYNYFNNSPTDNRERELDLGSKQGISAATTNKNPNRYLIRAAVSNDESHYIIGNPLSSNVDNMPLVLESSAVPRQAPPSIDTTVTGARTLAAGEHPWTKDARYLQADGSISEDTRLLTYYRPGRPSDESPSSANVIAPRFMVASSYGVTTSVLRENAIRRCASYQEEGYPAGRWRVPTTAEVMYCIQLSKNGMIPRLFSVEPSSFYASYGCSYYTTTGYVTSKWNGDEEVIKAVTSDEESIYPYASWVRCVYDIWYWGEDMPLEKETYTNNGSTVTGYRFTWGDMPE
jgi:hypothetical protein